MDDEGLAVGIIALVLALAALGLVLALPAGISGTGLLFTNGTRPLTANWNAGAYNITASWFKGNIALGSLNISDWGTYINQPLLTSSNVNFGSVTLSGNLILGANTITTSNTSLIANLNADLLDSQHGSYYRNATNINAGTLSLTYIPTMDDGHIPNVETLSYGGAFATAQIPTLTLSTSNITSGTFALGYIPRLDLTKIPFGTSGNLSTLVGFNVTSRSSPLNAHQGVAFDGTYYYTTKSPVGVGDYIYKYNTIFALIDSRDVSGDLPVGFTQINSMYYKDGLLYVGCSNVAVTPKKGYIVVFNVVDLSLNATHTVKALWTEGCAFYNSSWWVVYDGGDESKIVSKYDASWNWVADYDLTFSQTENYESNIKGYQGIRWIGDYLFVNSHENLIPATLDVYKWNGAGFDNVTRAAQPSLWASQGFDLNVDGSIWYFIERYYSGNTSDYRIITATPIEQGYFLEGFDSPTDSVYNILSASDVPTLDASKIITGVFDLSRIPVLNDAHIPNVETLSYGGAFATAQIPSLDASKITSGTFGTARLDLSALAQNIAFTSTQTVDGVDISAYINQAVLTTSSPTFNHIHLSGLIDGVTTISMNNQLTNTLAIGTAPFVITSTTKVANLNVEKVDGYDLNQALLTTSSPTFVGLLGSPYMDSYGTDYGTVLNLDFEEGTGTTAFDSSPYGNDGTITGATWVAGKFGKALSFDGNDVVTVADSVSLKPTSTGITVSCWVKLNNIKAGEYPAFVEKDHSSQFDMFLYPSGLWRLICYPAATRIDINCETVLSTGTWYFCVGTYDVATHTGYAYLDGVQSISYNGAVGNLAISTLAMTIGCRVGTDYLNGTIDDVRVYSRALTASEVKTIWLSGQGKYSSSTIISDKFRILGTDLVTDFSVINGVATATNGLATAYMSGDYGLTWTQTMPTGINGMMVTVYNSNAGILSSRWYIYTNGAWKYSALV